MSTQKLANKLDNKLFGPRGTILITSGASGGHIFPALAVATELQKMGLTCLFVLGGSKFNNLVDEAGFASVRLPASAFTDRGLLAKIAGAFKLGLGVLAAVKIISQHKPLAVFGTGGYASVATMLAARAFCTPTFVHEANVIPGRANRFLATFATYFIGTFSASKTYLPHTKIEVLGTPLRQAILDVASKKRKPDGLFNLLVLGGSQGAKILSDVIPEAIVMLTPTERKTLSVVHQARPEDVARMNESYKKLKLAHTTVQAFFTDMPERYVAADVVLGRSGAGTILEASTVGRAAIYVPHQLADNHQLLNAQVAEQAGAAILLTQPEFTPTALVAHLRALMQNPAKREAMAKAALTIPVPNAAVKVATFIVKKIEK